MYKIRYIYKCICVCVCINDGKYTQHVIRFIIIYTIVNAAEVCGCVSLCVVFDIVRYRVTAHALLFSRPVGKR